MRSPSPSRRIATSAARPARPPLRAAIPVNIGLMLWRRGVAPFSYAAAPMRILILGGDGYLGWPTALRFSARGHEVYVVDNFSRRRWHEEAGTGSLTPIAGLDPRIAAWK